MKMTMNIKHKKLLQFFLVLLFLIVLIVAVKTYFPVGKIFHLSPTPYEEFVNRRQIRNELPNSLYFDFEVDPNSAIPSGLYKGIAHSGQFSAKVFGKNSYSLNIERKVAETGTSNLKAIAISSWVFIFPTKSEVISDLALAISNGLGVNVTWKKVKVEGNEIPMGKWFKVSGLFDLSDIHMKPDYKIQVYYWNNSNTDILVDDFYIVFGGPKPHKGDSTLVDLTHGVPFTPKFNFPPYPFHLFGKEEINNENSYFLIKYGKTKEGDISPYDRIFSGHFISDNRGTEDLLVINKAGNAELFTFCKDNKVFRKITPVIPPDLQLFFQSAEIITGCFSGGGTAQLLLSGPKGLLVGEFEKVRDACSGNEVRASFKTLLKTTINPFSSRTGHLIAADLDGNKIAEILSIAENGSWKLFRFVRGESESLTVIASGEGGPLKQWNSPQNNLKITPGRFLQKYPQDILLTVSREKTKPGYSWSLLRFDLSGRSFIPCFNEKQNHLGKTIGLDTLKPGDEIFTGTFDNSGKIQVFRYNRDWRYDLKEIRFNDSTFQVIANMNFTGYEKDFDPKYYEILRIVPAMLISPGLTSLLVIGKNCKKKDLKEKECKEFIDLPALPGILQVYSFQKTEK
ncbi:MAG: hypothetical protein D4R97_09485 [Bacteroidetes bacterium]|nr:MAG: hypothetical protein D4R97_09485 [Bacteroidota bacterium]